MKEIKTPYGHIIQGGDRDLILNFYTKGRPWEKHLMDVVEKIKKPGVAIDAGTHVGTWTLFLSTQFESVVGFDINPTSYQYLLQNIHNNNIKNVNAYFRALTDKPDQIIKVHQHADINPGMTRIANDDTNFQSYAMSETIDRVCHNLNISFIKMDLEDHEPDALEGARKTIERCRPHIFIEDYSTLNERTVLEKFDYVKIGNYSARQEDKLFVHKSEEQQIRRKLGK